MTAHQFLWLDLETTGLIDSGPCSLKSGEGLILEWAVVLAADGRDGDMSVVQQFTGTIAADVDPDKLSAKVRAMHTANGLLAACRLNPDSTIDEADEFLSGLCVELAGRDANGIVLAGNNVGEFDLVWIREQMPKFAKHLSYRTLNVRTLMLAADSWASSWTAPGEGVESKHRALDDVLYSLEVAKAWRKAIML